MKKEPWILIFALGLTDDVVSPETEDGYIMMERINLDCIRDIKSCMRKNREPGFFSNLSLSLHMWTFLYL